MEAIPRLISINGVLPINNLLLEGHVGAAASAVPVAKPAAAEAIAARQRAEEAAANQLEEE